HLRPERQAPTAHRLGIRCPAAAYMGEVPVHQISPHLPLQHLIAPVPDVFEHQQSQYHVGRCTPAATATALGMPFRQSLIATIASSASTTSACFIQFSRRSLTSSAINPSPKLSCARRISIMPLPSRL